MCSFDHVPVYERLGRPADICVHVFVEHEITPVQHSVLGIHALPTIAWGEFLLFSQRQLEKLPGNFQNAIQEWLGEVMLQNLHHHTTRIYFTGLSECYRDSLARVLATARLQYFGFKYICGPRERTQKHSRIFMLTPKTLPNTISSKYRCTVCPVRVFQLHNQFWPVDRIK